MFAGIFGGAVASIAGFGIGSLLTPAIAATTGTKLAVAAVSIPHAIGTSIRFWRFRREIDWTIVEFRLHERRRRPDRRAAQYVGHEPSLEIVFGCLLVLAGASQVTGYAKRWRLRGTLAWLGGALSGFFGGLVGNQGGIRTAAMLGFEVDKRQFVATTTAVALMIDMARVPVYLVTETAALARLWPTIAIATIGVVIGTLFGERLLARVPEQRFRMVVGVLLLLLGVSFLIG